MNTIQVTAWEILCAMEGCKKPEFVEWANKWLSGEDRSTESARALFQSGILNHKKSGDPWDYVASAASHSAAYPDCCLGYAATMARDWFLVDTAPLREKALNIVLE